MIICIDSRLLLLFTNESEERNILNEPVKMTIKL